MNFPTPFPRGRGGSGRGEEVHGDAVHGGANEEGKGIVAASGGVEEAHEEEGGEEREEGEGCVALIPSTHTLPSHGAIPPSIILVLTDPPFLLKNTAPPTPFLPRSHDALRVGRGGRGTTYHPPTPHPLRSPRQD